MDPTPIPHDGWRSRAVVMSGSLIGLTIVGVAAVVATGKVDQFMVIAPWLGQTVMGLLGIALGSTTIGKIAQALQRK